MIYHIREAFVRQGGLTCVRGQEQGENLRWSYMGTISRRASLDIKPKIILGGVKVINKDFCDK